MIKQRILQALYRNGSLTVKALSSICGLPVATCTRAANSLCALNLAKKSVSLLKNGRKQTKFSAVKSELCSLGIHLLSNRVIMAVVNAKGEVIESVTLERDVDYSDLSNINEIAENAERLISRVKKEIKSVGISYPGPISLENGLLRPVINVGGINVSLLAEELKNAFELNVKCSFDSESAGEYYLALYPDASRGVTCCVRSGETVTSAIYVDGTVIRSNGFTGLLGHTGLNFRDERCYCGNRGCLEEYASTSLLSDKIQSNTLFGVTLRTFDETVEQYKSGDPSTVKEVDTLASYLAIGLVNMIWLLNPSHIYISGDLTKFGGVLSGPIHSVIKQRVLPEAFSSLSVTVADNSLDEACVGAALSAFADALENKFKPVK